MKLNALQASTESKSSFFVLVPSATLSEVASSFNTNTSEIESSSSSPRLPTALMVSISTILLFREVSSDVSDDVVNVSFWSAPWIPFCVCRNEVTRNTPGGSSIPSPTQSNASPVVKRSGISSHSAPASDFHSFALSFRLLLLVTDAGAGEPKMKLNALQARAESTSSFFVLVPSATLSETAASFNSFNKNTSGIGSSSSPPGPFNVVSPGSTLSSSGSLAKSQNASNFPSSLCHAEKELTVTSAVLVSCMAQWFSSIVSSS